AVFELLIDPDPELRGQRLHPVVRVADPLGAKLEGHPLDILRQDTAADPPVGLQDQRLVPGGEHVTRGDKPRQPAPDDDHISFARHDRPPDPCPGSLARYAVTTRNLAHAAT